MSLVSVYNEWDPLEEIIVGSALNARIPKEDKGFMVIEPTAKNLLASLPSGIFPEKIIEETEEDIEIFIKILEGLNIKVRRPEPIPAGNSFSNSYWKSDFYFNYCPRDVLITLGNMIIETPNVYRSRYFETFCYKDMLTEYMLSGAKWLSAPKPKLLDELYNETNPDELALRNLEPAFDAANILRAGRDIFYLISDSGNELGYKWLKNILGDDYRIHPCYDLYTSVHIDTTFCLLRPGLVLINPAFIKSEDRIPDLLKSWDMIRAPEMIDVNYSDVYPMASEWLGMNLLMLNPKLAVVDQDQLHLIKLLEEHNIEVIPLLLRHGRVLGGGVHCITLDVRRKGELEDYF